MPPASPGAFARAARAPHPLCYTASTVPAFLYTSPIAAGKTAWAIRAVRRAASGLQRQPLVVVATPLQARAFNVRLAAAGGALGVRVLTFDELYITLIEQARVVCTEVDGAVRHRLLRTAVDDLMRSGRLDFYRNLVARPGFVAALEGLIVEWKGANIRPARLVTALEQANAEPRLRELAAIFARYQALLDDNGWTDRAGLGWRALHVLADNDLQPPAAWAPVIFDGFDSFTVLQQEVMAALAGRVEELYVLLTGAADSDATARLPLFAATLAAVSQRLGVAPERLPDCQTGSSAFAGLSASLFGPLSPSASAPSAPLTMMAAADRTGEVRAALRWLKACAVDDGVAPGELALLARNLPAYRDQVAPVAAEFGVPVHFAGKLPLRHNPAVAALIDLLLLCLPDGTHAEPRLPRRTVVEAWRSPYFAWRGTPDAPDLTPGDADRLDDLARQYLVLRGLGQWQEAFTLAASRAAARAEEDGETDPPPADLAVKFARFVACLTPPAAARTMRDFAGWLETLIGPDPVLAHPGGASAPPGFTLDMVELIRSGDPTMIERDVAALRAFKDILRGLVWSEELAAGLDRAPAVTHATFMAELVAAADAATYAPPAARQGAVLVADLTDVRGLSFHAVAMIGMAEGELPQHRREDPFLRDSDRTILRGAGLPLESSTRSFEREYFAQAVARARSRLLLTRPRLAEDGAAWEPSPFWEEVARRTGSTPQIVAGEQRPGLATIASLPELLESATRRPDAADWLAAHRPEDLARLRRGAEILHQRAARHAVPGPYNGDLGDDAARLTTLRESLDRWSPSRLESYRACPAMYYVAQILGLERRVAPAEGLDAAQLGNIHHRLLEEVYRGAADPGDRDALLAALPAVARRVLDEAPHREGFRVTAWWRQLRVEIERNVARTIGAMSERGGAPIAFEARFGGEQPLELAAEGGAFVLRGVVDRIDRLADGSLCIVDYKLGKSDYDDPKSLRSGKRLQLPLYALAVQAALALGPVSDGFYWFLHHAESGKWTLATFSDPATGATGAQGAMQLAVDYATAAVTAARRGEFAPQPPATGCPDYCPAAAFCWHYRPKSY